MPYDTMAKSTPKKDSADTTAADASPKGLTDGAANVTDATSPVAPTSCTLGADATTDTTRMIG